MMARRVGWGIAVASCALCAGPLAGQETALKGGIAISRFHEKGAGVNPWDDRLVATGVGGHVRFNFGRIALQPEIYVVTRGATQSNTNLEDEQIRLEYLELPVLIVVPLNVGRLQLYPFGGGMVAVETRCRFVQKEDGLKSSFGCDTLDPDIFNRRTADYGLVAGGGASYPIGSGRLFVEGRQTWGMRNMTDDIEFPELRHRTILLSIGYSLSIQAMQD